MSNYCVIVDLNGTLVDTEVAFFEAYRDVLASYDIAFTIEDFTRNWSTQGKKLVDFLADIGRSDLLPQAQAILAAKDKIFQDTLGARARLMPGSKEFLEKLKSVNLKLGVDSSSSRENIDLLLTTFDLVGIFDAISSGNMELDEQKYGERKRKSARLKALGDSLGFTYDKCIVIGDAEKDIKGASEAGMLSIAVPSQYTRTNDFSGANKVVQSLNEITIEDLDRLIGSTQSR